MKSLSDSEGAGYPEGHLLEDVSLEQVMTCFEACRGLHSSSFLFNGLSIAETDLHRIPCSPSTARTVQSKLPKNASVAGNIHLHAAKFRTDQLLCCLKQAASKLRRQLHIVHIKVCQKGATTLTEPGQKLEEESLHLILSGTLVA